MASWVTLGDAGWYGLMAGNYNTVTLSGGGTVDGNVLVGKNDTLSFSGSNYIDGILLKGSNVSGSTSGTTITGGTQINNTTVQAAIADAQNAADAASALSETPGVYSPSSITLSGSTLTIKAMTNLSENVIDITNLSLTNGTLIFDDNGYDGAKFIVNVSGNFTITSSGSGKKSEIKGINGASASDILFNVEGTGSTVSITGNSTNSIIGTILAPQRNVDVQSGTLTGAIIAGFGNSGKSYTLKDRSGFDIVAAPYSPPHRTPEPASLMLFGSGLTALWAVRKRRAVAV